LRSKITILPLLNTVFLGYMAWQQHATGGCPGCHKVPFFPVTDITVALSGVVTSLLLALFIYFSSWTGLVKYSCGTFSRRSQQFWLFSSSKPDAFS